MHSWDNKCGGPKIGEIDQFYWYQYKTDTAYVRAPVGLNLIINRSRISEREIYAPVIENVYACAGGRKI